jgi:hypothetical protein
MTLERLLDDAPLDASAAPVDQAHFPQAGLVGGVYVVFDNGPDVSRSERVKVYGVLDRDPHIKSQPAGYGIFLIQPRTSL